MYNFIWVNFSISALNSGDSSQCVGIGYGKVDFFDWSCHDRDSDSGYTVICTEI